MNDEAREEATRELDVVQRWMQAVITHPLGIASGVESPEARAELDVDTTHLESVIARSKALTSVERLAIYGNAYYARLLECLRDLFPALVDALGEELFDSFAFSYLQQYPSRSYTLEHLADRFVQFLEETRPELSESTGDVNRMTEAIAKRSLTTRFFDPDFDAQVRLGKCRVGLLGEVNDIAVRSAAISPARVVAGGLASKACRVITVAAGIRFGLGELPTVFAFE